MGLEETKRKADQVRAMLLLEKHIEQLGQTGVVIFGAREGDGSAFAGKVSVTLIDRSVKPQRVRMVYGASAWDCLLSLPYLQSDNILELDDEGEIIWRSE